MTGEEQADPGALVAALQALLCDEEALRRVTSGEVEALRLPGGLLLTRDLIPPPRDSQVQRRAVFDESLDAIVICDDAGRYVDCNPAACELFGRDRAEMLGRTTADFSADPSDGELRRSWDQLRREGIANGVLRAVRPDGEVRIAEYRARADFVPGRHLAVFRDVTHERRQAESLMWSKRMEAVGRLAGGMAHELNNRLAAIIGFASVVHDELEPDDPLRDDIQQVLDSAGHAGHLMRQLMAFGRRQQLSPQHLPLNRLARQVRKMVERLVPASITFAGSLDADPDWVRADPGQMEQVLVNLILNARDAMQRGGVLTIDTRRDVSAPGDDLAAGTYLVVSVRDTGAGLTDEVREHMFEPFFSTKPGGPSHGLGLATAYGIVRQSGGSIRVVSEPGRGACLEVWLPAADPPVHARPAQTLDASQPPPSVLPAGRGSDAGLAPAQRVLLVEDEPAVRRAAQRILSRQGFAVTEASNGHEALERWERDGPFAAVVTDVVMPGMGGIALSRELRRRAPGLPLLFMTGYTDDVLAQEQTSSTRILYKPFSPRDLVAELRQLVDDRVPSTGDS